MNSTGAGVDPDLGPTSGEVSGQAGASVWDWTVALVAVGGALGALTRYGLGRGFPTAGGTFPVTTLAINLSGSLLLGLLIGAVGERRAAGVLRPLLGAGVLGGFTTFSTFAVDTDRLVSGGHVLTAIAYVAASLVGGITLAAGGLAMTGGQA